MAKKSEQLLLGLSMRRIVLGSFIFTSTLLETRRNVSEYYTACSVVGKLL
ncbi:hypothetical protein WN51_03932 [Melipona quadrifasciata]|uniref:Uncharacterized protein n=1 Tax=Melipona quadrifasciata TaxID=166423 RepID=A0A0M8ZRE9_9HYME|nr:hypothetical protein WN51_03932 [Melipona quadrifasciata]